MIKQSLTICESYFDADFTEFLQIYEMHEGASHLYDENILDEDAQIDTLNEIVMPLLALAHRDKINKIVQGDRDTTAKKALGTVFDVARCISHATCVQRYTTTVNSHLLGI